MASAYRVTRIRAVASQWISRSKKRARSLHGGSTGSGLPKLWTCRPNRRTFPRRKAPRVPARPPALRAVSRRAQTMPTTRAFSLLYLVWLLCASCGGVTETHGTGGRGGQGGEVGGEVATSTTSSSVASSSSGGACSKNAACDDANPCTLNYCQGGTCVFPDDTSYPPCPGGKCFKGACCLGCISNQECVTSCPGGASCSPQGTCP